MDQNTVGSVQLIETREESPSHPAADLNSKCPLCGVGEAVHFMTAPDRFHWRPAEYDLVRCPICSHVWLANPPKPEEMCFHYSKEYHRAIMTAGEKAAPSRWRRQRDVVARYKNGGAILDMGCSSGGFLGTVKGGSWRLYGIEMEASTAQKATAATGAEVFVGDVLAAPFPAASFDVITGFDILEHVYHPRQFLTKVLEWLKPGGIFYVKLPNIDSWEARLFGTYWYGLELPRHLSHFSPKSLRQVTASLGFREISVTTPRTSYVKDSVSYLGSKAAEMMGMKPIPMSSRGPRSIPFRAVRKAFQLSMVEPFAEIAAQAGAGPSIEAVFGKNVSSADKTSGVSGGKA
jgi:SAM-dependent methyltransferase